MSIKLQNIKFHENPFNSAKSTSMHTDRRAEGNMDETG
jgi:hypothetical protein